MRFIVLKTEKTEEDDLSIKQTILVREDKWNEVEQNKDHFLPRDFTIIKKVGEIEITGDTEELNDLFLTPAYR